MPSYRESVRKYMVQNSMIAMVEQQRAMAVQQGDMLEQQRAMAVQQGDMMHMLKSQMALLEQIWPVPLLGLAFPCVPEFPYVQE